MSTHGLTVFFDASGSTDPDGDELTYSIVPEFFAHRGYFYPQAWHTYKRADEYEVSVYVYDQETFTVKTFRIAVNEDGGNQAPVARITGVRQHQSIVAFGASSYDPEGTPLTYEWNFGDGPFIGEAHASLQDCESWDTSVPSRVISLTVSDGELKNTAQQVVDGDCGAYFEITPSASFSYRIEGNTVFFDASNSIFDTGLAWNFGDGSTGTGILTSHTYASLGTYNIKLSVTGSNAVVDTTTQSVRVGNNSSESQYSSSRSSAHVSSPYRSSSSLMSSSTSSRAFDSAASIPSSSLRSSSSQRSSDRNLYIAPRATTAPVIDGVVDSVWDRASWSPINVFWLGTQSNPSAQDYSGRYKALWDENYLYILYDITDDRIYDGVRDALDRYWEDDTVELFIDENKNGGQHGYNTSAWAYHISTYGDVVDSTTGGATLLNDHIDSRLVSNGTQHYWEMRIRIYGEDYADWKSNTPLTLSAGKLMGFSACYIDNDGSSQRESMMGSVDTQGHRNNQGYLDASIFGSMLLVE